MVTKKKESSTGKAASVKKASASSKASATKIASSKKSQVSGQPMTADQKLTRRKLDALKRGIHRITDSETTPFKVHVLGVGKAGADIVAQILKDKLANPSEDGSGFTALAVDIGDQDLAQVRELASQLPDNTAHVETLALEVPNRDNLFNTLRRMREFLKLEYPRYYWNPNYEPWLPSKTEMPEPGGHCARAVAKAIYAKSYYDDEREMRSAIRRFADNVDNAEGQSVVAVVFGLGGGAGSGMTVDLARHLSSVAFGRRVLVVGVAIAPCDGDEDIHKGSHLFPAFNELDCMGDESKNEGVVSVWGDLYRNPFTSGVIIVPQKAVWDATNDLQVTHQRIDREVSSFLTRNNGVDFWETLRMLNWVGAPPTQHAAARTPYGQQWAHVLGFVDTKDGKAATEDMAARLGIRSSYKPEFIEIRAGDVEDADTIKTSAALGKAFSPVADPAITVSVGADPGTVQFILPCISKTDFDLFFDSRDQYDTLDWEEKLKDHAWLLDLGVLLCEPAIRFDGMAGECLWGCACWVVVPYDQIRGPEGADSVVAA